MTLDFSVSSVLTDSGKHTASESELTLSSSHMVLMLVRTLTLPPQTTKRVYIFYRPWPGVGAGCDGKREREGVREAFEVTVRCRLIKDHQKVCVCVGGVVVVCVAGTGRARSLVQQLPLYSLVQLQGLAKCRG